MCDILKIQKLQIDIISRKEIRDEEDNESIYDSFCFFSVFAAGVKVDAAEVEMNVETGKDRNVVKMMGAPEFAIHYINPAKTSASFAID